MEDGALEHIYSLKLPGSLARPSRPAPAQLEPFHLETRFTLPKGEKAVLTPWLHWTRHSGAFFHFQDVLAKSLAPVDRVHSMVAAQKTRIRDRDADRPVSPLRAQVGSWLS
jgi:hypothetical protein